MKKPWYKRLEVWGTALQGLSTILMLLPSSTTAYKVGAGIGMAVGTVTQIKGLLKGYQADNLHPIITKAMDGIPNKVTGVKGSSNQLPSGLSNDK